MEQLRLRLRAPFAAFRPLAAGVFRGSNRTIPHSTAYGLLLNLAGIETRAALDTPVTQKAENLPSFELSVGDVPDVHGEPPRVETALLYQQLHGYPVGESSKELAAKTHGAKYHIAPVRRELLVGLDVAVAVRGASESLVHAITATLRGECVSGRYGLPFAGDNNLLFDRIEVLDESQSICWYTRVLPGEMAREGTVQLTSVIDRGDSARTVAGLFAPIAQGRAAVPDSAWVAVR
ncbi:MAG: CRISPR-associated protein Cas5 [Deltaproteobacteria bacterium]|nr:CRISPR-associated protein Cas5 [Deltaproteobacteria bacterium]